MKIKASLVATPVVLAMATSSYGAVVVGAAATPIAVTTSDYVGTGTNRGAITLPVSASAGAGYYTYAAGNAMALCASGSGLPTFALTFTNSTGATIDSFTIGGLVYQFKDNSSNVVETLTASVTGAVTIPTPSALNISSVSNNGDANSTPNNPALTAAYSVLVSGIEWLDGTSFTITWTDANDLGTDAMFGLGGATITATTVPEPEAAAILGAVGLLGIFRRRR